MIDSFYNYRQDLMKERDQLFDYPQIDLKKSKQAPVQYSQRRVIIKHNSPQNTHYYNKDTFDYRIMFMDLGSDSAKDKQLQDLYQGKYINYNFSREGDGVNTNRYEGSRGGRGRDRNWNRDRGDWAVHNRARNQVNEYDRISEQDEDNHKDRSYNEDNIIGKQIIEEKNSWILGELQNQTEKSGWDSSINNIETSKRNNQLFGQSQSEINPLKLYQRQISQQLQKQKQQSSWSAQAQKLQQNKKKIERDQKQQQSSIKQFKQQQQNQQTSKIDNFSTQYQNARHNLNVKQEQEKMEKENDRRYLLQDKYNENDEVEDIFELPDKIYISESINIEDILKRYNQQEQKQDKQQLQKQLKHLQALPMKQLTYILKTQNCSKITIAAILDPLNTPTRLKILSPTSYLKIENKKLPILSINTDGCVWRVGLSKTIIEPIIFRVRCYSCGRVTECHVSNRFCMGICSNGDCTKNFVVELLAIQLQ